MGAQLKIQTIRRIINNSSKYRNKRNFDHMKIRNGFVSNSSSTSFLIFGICIDEDEAKDLLGKDKNDDNVFIEANDIEEFFIEKELEVYSYRDTNQYFIGVDPRACQENETMGHFKQRVKDIFKCKGINTSRVGWIEEVIED
jgi:hypothetical protein